jgi:hypothetical protein
MAVVRQQTAVEHAVKWQADALLVGQPLIPTSTKLTLEGRSGTPSATF